MQLLLEVQGISYEVLMAPSILRAVQERLADGQEIELITFHYQQLEVGRGIPVLIGFLNEVEREFFTRFISVSGVGPRAALKALTQPIPVIAQAIDEGNITLLRSLPGIGEQRAKEIVAKLQGKVGKFALIQHKEGVEPRRAEPRRADTLADEAVAVLVQLEYKRPEARQMILNGINSGALLVNYIGHGWVGGIGSRDRAEDDFLATGDASLLNNGERMPVMTALTCCRDTTDPTDDSAVVLIIASQ